MSRVAALALAGLFTVAGCGDASGPDTTDPILGEPTDIRFSLSGDGALANTAVTLHLVADDGYELVGSTQVDSPTPTITVAPPSADELGIVGLGGGAPGNLYVAALHDDEDGDAEPDEGEVYLATTGAVVIFFLAEAVGDYPAGWSAVDFASFELVSLDGVPIEVKPRVDTLREGGDLPRVAAVPSPWLEDETFGTPIVDEVLTITDQDEGIFLVEVEGPPLEEQVVPLEGFPDGTVLASLFTYADLDASGSFSEGDEQDLTFRRCIPGVADNRIAFGWFPRTDDLALTEWAGGQLGWSLLINVNTPQGPQLEHVGSGSPPLAVITDVCPDAR